MLMNSEERLAKAKEYAKQVTEDLLSEKSMPTYNYTVSEEKRVAAQLHQNSQQTRIVSFLSRIYVGSVAADLTENDIQKLFSIYGYVKDVSSMYDPLTKQHKGFCFVEYDCPEGASAAERKMEGILVGGRTFKIGRPNTAFDQRPEGMKDLPIPPLNRLYVANIHDALDEDSLRVIFQPFGRITNLVIVPNLKTRKHKTYGYVEFDSAKSANAALAGLNGKELGGQPLFISKCVVGFPLPQGLSSLNGPSQ
jgi:poly(U)-binding-splicing factor PUF60